MKTTTPWTSIACLLLGVIFFIWGILMLVKDLYGVNFRSRYMQYDAIGGELVILFGLVFVLVAYFSLSPFSKIRSFIEGGRKPKRKKTT